MKRGVGMEKNQLKFRLEKKANEGKKKEKKNRSANMAVSTTIWKRKKKTAKVIWKDACYDMSDKKVFKTEETADVDLKKGGRW